MADKTEVAITLFPKIEDRVASLADALEKVAIDRAPEAWATAKTVVQVDAVDNLMWAGIWAVGLIVTYFAARRAWSLSEGASEWFRGDARFFTCAASAIFGTGFSVGLFSVVGPWTWVALIRPELAIAKQIMKGLF